MKFATKPVQHYPPHLRHVATLAWEMKKAHIFCRYKTDMEENANKLHLSAPILRHSVYRRLSGSDHL